MGTTKTKRAEEKAERKGGVTPYIYASWKEWIDKLYVEGTGDPANTTEFARNFLSVWNPIEQPVAHQVWRQIVQQAFFAGYTAGFTTRILKGETHE